jgi:hypothetical protein
VAPRVSLLTDSGVAGGSIDLAPGVVRSFVWKLIIDLKWNSFFISKRFGNLHSLAQ